LQDFQASSAQLGQELHSLTSPFLALLFAASWRVRSLHRATIIDFLALTRLAAPNAREGRYVAQHQDFGYTLHNAAHAAPPIRRTALS